MNYAALAEQIATYAHDGQKRQHNSEEDFLEHPRRIVSMIDPTADNYTAKACVAWLHDVLEDTEVTPQELLDAGLPSNIVDAVIAITHLDNEPRTSYYDRILKNHLATQIKILDMLDNLTTINPRIVTQETLDRLTTKYTQGIFYLVSRMTFQPSLFDEPY